MIDTNVVVSAALRDRVPEEVILSLSVVGWGLVWLVVSLAGANLFLGFCAGCFVYYQLNRLHVPGFRYSRLRRS